MSLTGSSARAGASVEVALTEASPVFGVGPRPRR